jgi:thiosulfate/3-mercaptopyruvate sulfurtransferase
LLLLMQEAKKDLRVKFLTQEKNVRSGSIPNSICLPFMQVINEDYSFKNAAELKSSFENILEKPTDKPVFSCGSGVTACVLALAYSLVNANYLPVIYDGSWAEYGKI